MGWTETCAMNERERFVHEALRMMAGDTMSSLCERYGVSRKTGYKWLERYEQEGRGGLSDRSRAPHEHPNALDERLEKRILSLRRSHRDWGAKKLLPVLEQRWPGEHWPAHSTVGEILKRAGLIEAKSTRPRSKPAALNARPIQADEPNALWTIDFKGTMQTLDRCWSTPLTLQDAASRYLFRCQNMRPNEVEVRYWMERTFRRYGLPWAIRSDNGTPFAAPGLAGLSRLSVWWLKLGIEVQRSAPGHPEHNPRHERMHRTLKGQVKSPRRADPHALQRALDRFRRSYNHERPHESLGQRTPANIYRASIRPYPKTTPQFVYPDDMVVLRVRADGMLIWDRREIYLSEALRTEWIGLRPIESARWAVFLGTLPIATFDARTRKVDPYTESRRQLVRDAV